MKTPICRGRIAAPLLLGALLSACAAADAPEGIEYRPDADLPRLEPGGLAPAGAGLIRDFDLSNDTLVLLDRAGTVFVLARDTGGFVPVRQFGRNGDGPGEFRNPSGIALTARGRAVVVEAARMQTLRLDGAVESVERLNAPCMMALPAIASTAGGSFLSGDCHRSGYVTDTVKAVLAWRSDSTGWRVVAEEAKYTLDGRLGTVFGAPFPFTPAANGEHVFGTGTSNCLWTVTTVTTVTAGAAPPPAVARGCPAAAELYTAPPPPGLEERLRARRFAGVQLSWPATLPVYVERVVVRGMTVLLRPFTADSLVLQVAAPDGRNIAVAPHGGLVSCKVGACLWVMEDSDPMQMVVLDSARLGALIDAAVRPDAR